MQRHTVGWGFLDPSLWTTLEHISLVLLIGIGFTGYRGLLHGYRLSGQERRRHTMWFLAALVGLYLAESPPLHVAAEGYLLSAHMIQHLLFIIVIPVGILLGLPPALWDQLVGRGTPARLAAFLTHPATAFLAFSFVYNVWHVPAFYELALRVHWIHGWEHVTFLTGALLMWWPLLHPAQRIGQTSSPVKLLYLFGLSASQLAIVGPLVFLDQPAYAFYAAAPRLFGVSLIEDQQLAGILMKMPTLLLFGALFCYHFLAWARSEEN